MTTRQFYFIFSIYIISLKIQKMPCVLYEYMGKDSYVMFFIFMLVDFVGVIISLMLSKQLRKFKINTLSNKKVIDIFVKIFLIFVSIYFLAQAILLYEAIQDLFSHILFNDLSWKIFGLFLLGAIFFMASFDYDNIGRIGEIFFPFILFSLIFLCLFGIIKSNFSAILPFQTLKNYDYFDIFKKFSIWFGDFFLIIFVGTKSNNISLKHTILTYGFSMLFVIIFIISFESKFLVNSSIQPSVISVISEQSLLSINIGRIDWLFILIAEVGTVISASLCLCIAKKTLFITFKKVKINYYLMLFSAVIYLLDINYLVDLTIKEQFFLNFSSYFAFYLKVIVIVILFFKIINNIKSNSKNKNFYYLKNAKFKTDGYYKNLSKSKLKRTNVMKKEEIKYD